ncbi:putative RNA exonuclease pqe-1 isoform X2 [Capsella rubella]|uniref:putative RNA exonuclease pqe-1 isoform X2 n=1 Tax=Capsella rubella TaxID=81985 RepID=UPI000CD573B0|nr:putative RNA exonuclease pqe-1 isoform X2 [Capsella rubella]
MSCNPNTLLMEEQREDSEFCNEPMEEEATKGLGLSSKNETLGGEDTHTVHVSDSGVSGIDADPDVGVSATQDGNTDNLVSDEEEQVKADDVEVSGEEPRDNVDDDVEVSGKEPKDNVDDDVEVSGEEPKDNVDDDVALTAKSEVKSNHGEGKYVSDEEANCEVEDNGDSEKKADQEKESAKKSEAAVVPEESNQFSERETKEVTSGTVLEVNSASEINDEGKLTSVDQKEENGEAMEIDNEAEEQVEDDVKVCGALDSACNESAGASVVQTQDISEAEADVNNSNVVDEMEIDERKDNADTANDLTDLAIPNSPSENAAPGNIQDLKTDTRNISLKEDKKAADIADEVASVSIENGSSEARVASGAQSPAATIDCSKEASDAILGSEENQESKDHECLEKETADQNDTMREEEDITHESQSIDDPNKKEDTEIEEYPNISDYAADEAGSDIKSNGVKQKADVLSEDSPGEGRKTFSLAKVSFAQRPSFKIGACIARAASQMAGSSSVLKGSNFDGETLSVESFVSQLHYAATDPDKENIVSEIAAGFFLDFRNSSALQQGTPELVSKKRGRPSNSTGTEAFEFEEMGDTYWTDRVIHNGGEEQTSPTEKENYQVVPVELKPAQVQRTRRPYRRRQTQINIPLSVSDKPANFDENAPAELVMKFSEVDTIPPEKSLSKMFRHFGPIKESQTEVDKENKRARVVYRKGADAEVAYNSAGRFSIFGTKAVNYELSYTITETFKVQPYVVSLGEEDAVICLPS